MSSFFEYLFYLSLNLVQKADDPEDDDEDDDNSMRMKIKTKSKSSSRTPEPSTSSRNKPRMARQTKRYVSDDEDSEDTDE